MNIFDLSAKITLDTAEYRAQVRQSREEIKEAEKGMKDAGTQSETLKNKLSFLTQQYKTARANVDQLTKSYNESMAKTGALSNETIDLARQLDKAEKEARELKTSLDQYTTTTGNAASQTKKSTGDMSNSWNGFNVTVLGIITGIVTAATSAVTSLTKIGLQFNQEIEGYTTNFKVLLGDSELAAEKVDQLKEMAASTPFGIGDLSQATQTLLAFDIEAEKTDEILQMLGDAALGDKNRMQALTLSFSQATSAGKLMGQDLMQMINAGFNPLNSIAKETGLSIGQLKEIMGGTSEEARETMLAMEGVTDYGKQIIEQGYISADDLYKALQMATSEGGLFYKGMEESSKTVSGLLSTLKDDAQSVVGMFFEPVSGLLKESILPNAIAFVNAIGALADGGSADAVVESIVNIANGIGSFIKENAGGFEQTGVSIIVAIADGLSAAADALIDPLVNAIDGIFANIPADRLSYSAGRLIGTLIRALSAVFRAGSGAIGQFLPVLISAIPVFLSALLSNIDYRVVIETMFFPIIDAVIDNLPEIIDALSYALPLIISAVLVDGVANAAPDIIDGIVNVIWSVISSLFRSVIRIVVDIIPLLINTVISYLAGYADIILSVIKGLLEQIGKVPATIASIFRGDSTVEEAMQGFGNWLSDKVGSANVKLDYAMDWLETETPALSWEEGFSTSEYRGKLENYENMKIDKVENNVFVNGTNATPEEISDAVAEGMAIALQDYSDRKAATYGKKALVAR